MRPSKITLAFFVIVVAIISFKFCFQKVALNEVGIVVNNLGGGVKDKDYEPGYYLIFPLFQKMFTVDPTVQALHLTDAAQAPDGLGRLEVTGIDQYKTLFDITVLYRLKPGDAHLAVPEVGMKPAGITRILKSKAEKALYEALGRLTTQEFYNVTLREKARTEAKRIMSDELQPNHVELVDVLIRAIDYDAKVEERLVEKQLLDQRRALTEVKADLEGELEKTQAIERGTEALVKVIAEEMIQEVATIVAETDARVQEINADAELTAETLIAEADRHRREKVAAAELAKTEAKAIGEKAINEAYLGGGGQAYITRQMIDNIEFGEIEVNTNAINPFDVAQLLEMLGLDLPERKGK